MMKLDFKGLRTPDACQDLAYNVSVGTAIAILHSITDLLSSNPYVIVLALDFSKAFDSVRQSILLQKIAMLDIPDSVYNWLVDFFSDRRHCTRYKGSTSTMIDITASIIQGSAVGPVSYVTNAADLNTLISSNYIYKYADDTYIVIPASNAQSRAAELNHVAQWAHVNNLRLNRAKSTEIVFSNSRHKRSGCHPPELPDIKRVTTITILGVTITNHFSSSEHVSGVITKMCTVAPRTQNLTQPWYVGRGFDCYLQSCGHSQSSSCNPCLVGIYCRVGQAKT